MAFEEIRESITKIEVMGTMTGDPKIKAIVDAAMLVIKFCEAEVAKAEDRAISAEDKLADAEDHLKRVEPKLATLEKERDVAVSVTKSMLNARSREAKQATRKSARQWISKAEASAAIALTKRVLEKYESERTLMMRQIDELCKGSDPDELVPGVGNTSHREPLFREV